MKVNRYGQAKILTQPELDLLFSEGLITPRDKALFGVALWTAARINEVCTLLTTDVWQGDRLLPEITLRWYNVKNQSKTRQIPISPTLRELLINYGRPTGKSEYLFPGRHGRNYINPQSASHILRDACKRVGFVGVSTHSFRRSSITAMHRNGVGLKTIQSISGHSSLLNLQRYIEISDDAKREAVDSLKF